jgi:hypothetical protein
MLRIKGAIHKTVINHSWQNWMQWKTFDLLKSAADRLLRVISAFRHEEAANCALLGCYAASGGYFLTDVWGKHIGTAFRGSRI